MKRVEKIHQILDKAKAVEQSCKTREQELVACAYRKLASKRVVELIGKEQTK